jgi:hypothetical protein
MQLIVYIGVEGRFTYGRVGDRPLQWILENDNNIFFDRVETIRILCYV